MITKRYSCGPSNMTNLEQDPVFLQILHSADKEWPGYKAPDDNNASLPLLISEIYRLIPYIGSEYVHFHPKNMPEVEINKVEIIGIVTDRTEMAKYTLYTVDDSTGAIPVLCMNNMFSDNESTSDESDEHESSDDKEGKKSPGMKLPFGLAAKAPYSYARHIQNLWLHARDEEPMHDEVELYDYVHVLGFCAMDFRNQKEVGKLTDEDIVLGRLFFFGINVRRISEAEHNAMTKTLIGRLSRERYLKPTH